MQYKCTELKRFLQIKLKQSLFEKKKMKFLTLIIMLGLLGSSVLGQPQRTTTPPTKNCLLTSGSNLIQNGDFQNVICSDAGDFCIWDASTFDPTYLPNWTIGTSGLNIAVGLASNFNSAWDSPATNYVVSLDPISNTCIMQTLALKRGTYNLIFNWAAFEGVGVLLDTSKVNVKVNGRTIVQLPAAVDFSIQTANVLFDINQDLTNATIELCGAGTSDGSGASVDNVQLISYTKCPTA